MTSLARDKVFLSPRFSLCQSLKGNKLLNRILQLSISTIFGHIPEGAIRDIQITGSVANGEGTVISKGSKIFSSDLDLLIYLKFQYYLLTTTSGLGKNLSDIVNSHLHSRGIRTHVSFNMSSGTVDRILGIFQTSSIYDYEFSYNKSLIGNRVVKTVRLPSREDALQLLFTTIAEHLTLYRKFDSQMERLYWLAKRYLTLLYSILIFLGKPKLTYEARVRKAMEIIPGDILPRNEHKLVMALLKFKLTGNPSFVYSLLHSKYPKRVINLLEEKLLSMALKVLSFQLATFYSIDNSRSGQSLVDLLNLYFLKTKKSAFEILLYNYILSITSLLTKRPDKRRNIRIASMLRHSLLSTANYLVSLRLLYELDHRIVGSHMNDFIRQTVISREPDILRELWLTANELKYLR